MKLGEADQEKTGCDWFSHCPLERARCCLFCEEKDCMQKCDLIRLYPTQTKQWQQRIECPSLKSMQEITWKFLLGTKVP